ncbi:MAG: hypothetical protein IJT08_00145 [Alphaproteobacteria bacterium]|nr:hypothetical protein [Alphaproteobacteria bacterium]
MLWIVSRVSGYVIKHLVKFRGIGYFRLPRLQSTAACSQMFSLCLCVPEVRVLPYGDDLGL